MWKVGGASCVLCEEIFFYSVCASISEGDVDIHWAPIEGYMGLLKRRRLLEEARSLRRRPGIWIM